MPDYNLIFEQLLIKKDQRDDAYDTPTLAQVQELVIAFGAITTNRAQRMAIISEVVGRNLDSTKDLRLGEVQVLKDMLDNPNFIKDMRSEYVQQ